MRSARNEPIEVVGVWDTDKVFVGDICYALDDTIYQEKWGDGLGWSDGEIRARGNGNCGPICAVVGSTAYGDGCYEGSDNTEFGVDAGVIGVTNLKYKDPHDTDDETLSRLGKIVRIPSGKAEVYFYDDDGLFKITIKDAKTGKIIYDVDIQTRDDYEEEENDYEEDSYYEDEPDEDYE